MIAHGDSFILTHPHTPSLPAYMHPPSLPPSLPPAVCTVLSAQALIEFCRKQPSLLGVELLPFHQLGREKWRTLGWDYSAMEAVEPPTHQQVEAAVQQLEAGGLRVICDVQRVAPRPS